MSYPAARNNFSTAAPDVRAMTDTWYVTFETPRPGLLSTRRRTPRLTKTFATEAEAKSFARQKVEEGVAIFAGTLDPRHPKHIILANKVSDWIEG